MLGGASVRFPERRGTGEGNGQRVASDSPSERLDPFFAPDEPSEPPRPLVDDAPAGEAPAAVEQPSAGTARRKRRTAPRPLHGRLYSLDAFRGLTIAGMLLVNNLAVDTAAPEQFEHAAWGKPITVADLIFPWFLFIVGVAIPFSANGRREAGLSGWRRAGLVLQRTALLFGIGMLIDSSMAHAPVFGISVLQLIALAYLVGRCIYHAIPTPWRVLSAAVLLGCYGAALVSIPVPGQALGHMTEQNNIVQHWDDTILMRYSLEGLPSVLPTAALVILGTIAGDCLRMEKMPRLHRALFVCAGGMLLMAAGCIWGLSLVMHKSVWTPSYICFSAGWAALVLAALYVFVDVWNQRVVAYPLVVFGANALVAYAGAVLFKVFILQNWYTHSPLTGLRVTLQQGALDWCIRQMQGDRINGGWLYTVGYVAAWWLVCAVLYSRKILLRA
jgi:predicted acyltransferase